MILVILNIHKLSSRNMISDIKFIKYDSTFEYVSDLDAYYVGDFLNKVVSGFVRDFSFILFSHRNIWKN